MRPAWLRFRLWAPRVRADYSQKPTREGLAAHIASSKFDSEMNPKHWDLDFNTNLKAIQQFEAEYGDRP